MPTIQLLIKGTVQGVFYRATAKKEADALGLKGWIKNTKEGDVACMATGNEKAIEAFIEWCRKGPKRAIVTDVIITKAEGGIFSSFSIIE